MNTYFQPSLQRDAASQSFMGSDRCNSAVCVDGVILFFSLVLIYPAFEKVLCFGIPSKCFYWDTSSMLVLHIVPPKLLLWKSCLLFNSSSYKIKHLWRTSSSISLLNISGFCIHTTIGRKLTSRVEWIPSISVSKDRACSCILICLHRFVYMHCIASW